MTVAARKGCVLAFEREVRIASVIKARVVPVGRVVAGFAVLTAAAVVRVVVGVTSITGRRRVLVGGVGVAVKTRGFDMLADQRVVGRIVIERRVNPLSSLVTILASVSECRAMDIVVLMAVIACIGRFPVRKVAAVAVPAGDRRMRPEQLEIRKLVVERRLVQLNDIRIAA